MSHPYKHHANKSHKSKMGSLHKDGVKTIKNLDMQGSYKHVDVSTSHMQHKEQSGVPGMAKGGRLDRAKRGHKSNLIARGTPKASPSPDEMAAMQGAAGSSPPAAPPTMPPGMPPGMPMQKRGGKVHGDEAADKALIKKMVKPSAVKRAHGGRAYPIDAGQATGVARIEQAKKAPMKGIKGKDE